MTENKKAITVKNAWLNEDLFDGNGFYIAFDWSDELRELYARNPEALLTVVVTVQDGRENVDDGV